MIGKEIVQILMVWTVGSLARYVASAVGQKQLASALKLVTILICASIILPAVWEALGGVVEFFTSAKEWFEGLEQNPVLNWLFNLGAKEGG